MNTSFWNRINTLQANQKDAIIPYPSNPPSLQANDKCYTCRILQTEDISAVVKFLYNYFRKDSRSPDMRVEPEWLLADLMQGAYGIGCWHNTELIGVVWARNIGRFNRPAEASTMYIVEHLCVSPQHRKKGITRLLLNWVETVRPAPEVRFIFIKEGQSVRTSSISCDAYLYTRIAGKILNKLRRKLIGTETSSLSGPRKISLEEGLQLRDKLASSASAPYLWNYPSASQRTQLWAWGDKALLAITETHQVHPLDGQRIGLITGWLCDPLENEGALQTAILDAQPYTWIWAARSHIALGSPFIWNTDGLIWWQPYLWSAPTHPRNLFIVM